MGVQFASVSKKRKSSVVASSQIGSQAREENFTTAHAWVLVKLQRGSMFCSLCSFQEEL